MTAAVRKCALAALAQPIGGPAGQGGRRPSRCQAAVVCGLAILTSALPPADCRAVTPDSPEVLALVDKALAFLAKKEGVDQETRLGGKCLIALAFHKRGLPNDTPRIQEALEACEQDFAQLQDEIFIYNKGVAVIFLSEIDSAKYRELIDRYAGTFDQHQKAHGGFGYIPYETGDTSQTQYAALAYWEMLNHGMSPKADSVQRCLKWLMRTQDPTGAWGYQGQDPGNYSLVTQTDNVGLSMSAAGMGSSLILANSLGLLKGAGGVDNAPVINADANLPSALKRTDVKKKVEMATLPPGDVDRTKLVETIKRGNGWFDKNLAVELTGYQCYYLYSLERYKSFEEYLSGQREEEPDWYNKGFELLKETQAADGSWNDSCGQPCATAFAVLFLLRSTQQSIQASLGEGTLVGGRGLPRDLSKVKLRGGKLIVQQNPTELDQLIDMLGESDAGAMDALIDQPAALQVGKAGPQEARRLQQVARTGPPEARLLAVRALARLRSLDYAPTLIFALTDPDKRVVREARDGLRYVSRSFEGFGPPDNFDDGERNDAVERWKNWYRTVRPDAPPLP